MSIIKKSKSTKNKIKEKYLVVEKLKRGEITKIYIFKDGNLGKDSELLKQYELATKNKFNQDIKYFKEVLREIKFKNRKLNNGLER